MKAFILIFATSVALSADVIIPTAEDMCGNDQSCLRRNQEALHLYREQQKTILEGSSPKDTKPVDLGKAEERVPDFQKVRNGFKGFSSGQKQGNSYRDLILKERAKGVEDSRGVDYQMRKWNPYQPPPKSDLENYQQKQAEAEAASKTKSGPKEADLQGASETIERAEATDSQLNAGQADEVPAPTSTKSESSKVARDNAVKAENARETETSLKPSSNASLQGSKIPRWERRVDPGSTNGGYIRMERDGKTTVILKKEKSAEEDKASYIELEP